MRTVLIAYQVELSSNSLFYKLAKTIAELGNKVIAVGVKRLSRDSKDDIKVTFATTELPNVYYVEIPIKMDFAGGFRNSLGVLKYQLAVMREARKRAREVDIFYAIDFLMAIPLLFVAILKKKKLIYHIADNFVDAYKVPRFLKPFFIMIDRTIIRLSSAIVIPHESRITKHLQRYKEKIFIIYNTPEDTISKGIEATELLKRNPSKRLRIAYFGVLTEDRFLRELCEAVFRNNSLELHIGGYGPLESYISERAKQCERIIFYGKVSYQRVLDIQKSADLLVAMYDPSVPNNRRSCPNKLYEAMMLGKPIVVAKGMGIEGFVVSQNIGFVSEYSIESFEKLIQELLSKDRQFLESIGKNGRKLYEKEYSWEKMKDRIRKIVNESF